jgi:hypothetical protein
MDHPAGLLVGAAELMAEAEAERRRRAYPGEGQLSGWRCGGEAAVVETLAVAFEREVSAW